MPKKLSPAVGEKLSPEFYFQKTEKLAKALLGKRLVRVYRGRRRSGIIVETEAYLGERDAACHTWRGRRTERVASMYLDGGHSYVYMIYGMHYCFNVVARRADQPEAVLIRALDPDPGAASAERMDGPGRLCNALKINRSLDGKPLSGETIFIEEAGLSPRKEEVGVGPRIGVEYAGEAAEWPLRFFWRGSPHLSRKEKGWRNASPLIRPSGRIT
jgi:DNA-3-methyladenine glycosylase